METISTVLWVAAVAAASFRIALVAARLGLRLLLRAMVVGTEVVGTGKV
ncbi:MAG: hypothetical protein ABIZ80_07315 [Bryobacteraceae bacterium]